MSKNDEKIFSVTAITRLIKYTLEESFPSVWVEGEISNYVHHSSGHRYLVLKDDRATLRATIWRSVGQTLRFEPENGMKVRAFGDISVYEKAGNYQLNIRRLVPAGVGELEVAFRQLYEKLSKEGLFDESRKKPVPKFPERIGLVTSPTGAAIRDIIQIARRRNDSIRLILYPAQVQGKGAEYSIIAGIEYFNRRDDIDAIIIGRGGGSLEDLWAFNEEVLVRAVADSKKPIISAVGHEIDTTLSDLAADLRAPTPSAAAELIIWDKSAFLGQIARFLAQMDYYLKASIQGHKMVIRRHLQRPVLARPESLIREKQQNLDNLSKHLDIAGKNILEKSKNGLSLGLSRLESLSPMAILGRGYAVLKSVASGLPIKSVGSLRTKDLIEAILSDGSATARIEEVRRDKKDGGSKEKV
jgi:exodeoxyribonuclease VII large subunit